MIQHRFDQRELTPIEVVAEIEVQAQLRELFVLLGDVIDTAATVDTRRTIGG